MFIMKLFQKNKYQSGFASCWQRGWVLDLVLEWVGRLILEKSLALGLYVVDMSWVNGCKGGPYGYEVYEGQTKRAVQRLHKEGGKL